MDISLIIPAFNEGENVFLLASQIEKIKNQNDQYEIVFVDDGSTDDTLTQMLKAKKDLDLDITVIQSANRNGQSVAILIGVKESKYDWILTLDADLQNSPENFFILVNQIRENPDQYKSTMVSGLRQKRRDSLIKVISSKTANFIRQLILDDHCTDTGCALKLFHRSFFLGLPQFKNMHRFLPALFQMYGGNCIFVPVTHQPRTMGKSKYGTWDRLIAGIWDLFGVFWIKHRKIVQLTYTRKE